MNTDVFENPAFMAMRALVRDIIDRIEFRHHGIGALQGYVTENVEPEIRIHIWSPRLLKPGIDESGDVHDHRFDMVSHVLYGEVLHEEWNENQHQDGDHAMMSLTHARAAADTAYHGPTTALAGRYAVSKFIHVIKQGQSYYFPAKQFHRSPIKDATDLSITCIEKHRQQDVPARLLYPIGRTPVMAFGHRIDKALVRSIVAEAKEKLL